MGALWTRVIPMAEWGLLESTPLAPVLPTLPERTQILAVQHEGRIVGTWAILPYIHAEGLWIDPEYRNAGAVALRLLRRMPAIAASMGANGAVLTAALDQDLEGYLRRLGAVPLPGVQYVLPLVRKGQ